MAVILSFGLCQCKQKVGVAVPIPPPLLGEKRFPGRLLHICHFKKPIPLALPNQSIPIPPGLSEIALGQFGNCLEATTWNSKEVSICNEKAIERASARWARPHPFDSWRNGAQPKGMK